MSVWMTPGQHVVVMKWGGEEVRVGGGYFCATPPYSARGKLVSVEPKAPLHGFCMYKSDVVRVPCSATSISGRSLNKPRASKGREREREEAADSTVHN